MPCLPRVACVTYRWCGAHREVGCAVGGARYIVFGVNRHQLFMKRTIATAIIIVVVGARLAVRSQPSCDRGHGAVRSQHPPADWPSHRRCLAGLLLAGVRACFSHSSFPR